MNSQKIKTHESVLSRIPIYMVGAFLLRFGIVLCVKSEMAPKADIRPIKYEWVKALFLEAKERNIEFYFHQCGSMFIKDGINIGKWNLNDQIKRAEEIQHELEKTYE